MPLLTPDQPYGNPAFALSLDEVDTVIDLLCRGAKEAKAHVTPGMLEVPTTIVVRKAMRRVKRNLGLTNIEVRGEQEIDDMATADPTILGRIDITLKFLHQFGNEDAFVAIECKRVRAGDTALSSNYVSEGVERFATGKYAAGHAWGFMLGYVLALPVDDIVAAVDNRVRKKFGATAALSSCDGHPHALRILESGLAQGNDHTIRLKHVFVDMVAAAPGPS